MAGEPPRPRPTWRPPGDDPASSAPKVTRPATQIVRISELRASQEPPPPRASEPQPEEPLDLRGASTGRRLTEPDEAAPPPAPEPASPGGSPFQPFAGHSDRLTRAPRSDSRPILAIVGGLVAVVLAAVALVVVALVVGSGVMSGASDAGPVAEGAEPEHIGDVEVGQVAAHEGPVRRPGAAAAIAEPQRLDGTIVLGESRSFRSIEVNCTESGVRERADFRNGRATVRDLPTDEDCTVTFQGAEPARTTLRGGQTRRCVFGPTRCETL